MIAEDCEQQVKDNNSVKTGLAAYGLCPIDMKGLIDLYLFIMFSIFTFILMMAYQDACVFRSAVPKLGYALQLERVCNENFFKCVFDNKTFSDVILAYY